RLVCRFLLGGFCRCSVGTRFCLSIRGILPGLSFGVQGILPGLGLGGDGRLVIGLLLGGGLFGISIGFDFCGCAVGSRLFLRRFRVGCGFRGHGVRVGDHLCDVGVGRRRDAVAFH